MFAIGHFSDARGAFATGPVGGNDFDRQTTDTGAIEAGEAVMVAFTLDRK